MNSAALAGGLVIAGVGLVLVISGLAWLGTVVRKQKSKPPLAKDALADAAELLKQLTEFIKLVGVDVGVPMIVMILGVALVSIGAGLATTGAS